MENDIPIAKFLEQVAARTATPGGGSVSALAAAMGAALACMAARFSLPRGAGQPGVLAAGFESASSRLLELVSEDAAAYTKLAKALKMPKNDCAGLARRREAVESAAKEAAGVPLAALRLTCETLDAIVELAEAFNERLCSDLAVGTVILAAAARGLRMNVSVNLDDIGDVAVREKLRAEALDLETKCLDLEEEALARIWKSKKDKADPT